MKRLFIGIKYSLSDNYIQLLQQLKYKTSYDTITWCTKELYHCTLQFIGQTSETIIPDIEEILQNITQPKKSFILKINKLGVFGSSYHPTVIWLGINANENLTALHDEIHSKLSNELHIELPKENFVPHITLGRIRKIDNKSKFWKTIEDHQLSYFHEFNVNEILLYRTKFENNQPKYIPLKKFPLQK